MLGAHHNITELKKAEEKIIASKERAEENDRLKTAFLQNMSHEIRTPMNAIMGFSELLIRDFNDKSKLTHYAQIINQRCNDLLVIIDDILDIAKIESGQLSVNIEKCNLNLLFVELKMFFTEHQVKIKKQHVIFHIQTEKLTPGFVIETDKVKLKQILINLIGNAFKFTYEGKIETGCYFDSDNNIVFYVSDTGLGIHPNKYEQIFERFIQIDSDAKGAHGGTGLGLSIVKGLVGLLGGKIWLKSQPGQGSTFYFTIKTKFLDELHFEPLVLTSPMKNVFDNKTILIVEDDIFNAEYLKLLFSGKGMHIIQTETGREAIEISVSKHIDLVLMDIQLADMNGYDAILEIKKHKPDQKIIVQTAYAASEDKQKAFDSGCTDYISKPLKSDVLFSMLNKYLN
jgi:CheY-like chemotaxis protein